MVHEKATKEPLLQLQKEEGEPMAQMQNEKEISQTDISKNSSRISKTGM